MLLEEFDRDTNAIINPDMCVETISIIPHGIPGVFRMVRV